MVFTRTWVGSGSCTVSAFLLVRRYQLKKSRISRVSRVVQSSTTNSGSVSTWPRANFGGGRSVLLQEMSLMTSWMGTIRSTAHRVRFPPSNWRQKVRFERLTDTNAVERQSPWRGSRRPPLGLCCARSFASQTVSDGGVRYILEASIVMAPIVGLVSNSRNELLARSVTCDQWRVAFHLPFSKSIDSSPADVLGITLLPLRIVLLGPPGIGGTTPLCTVGRPHSLRSQVERADLRDYYYYRHPA